jgi:hypothetical protein
LRRRVLAAIAAVALAITGVVIGVQYILPGPAHADEDTVSQNLSRDGWDSSEPILSPATVSSKSFGQVFDTKVNGQVYAQPLNVGSSVIVATENDYVYSINRNTGVVNWSTQLGSPYAAAAENCTQSVTVQPYVGVTSTPVYDPTTGTLYVSGMVSGPPGDDSDLSTTTPQDDLFAINEATGAVDWSQTISGSPANDSKITFDAANQLQRTGLLLLNGWVYMGFGSLCEDGASDHNYDGFIAGVNTTTPQATTPRATTLWSDQSVTPAFAGGIWQGGGGLVSDGKSIYFSTGNGTVPPAGMAGSSAPSAGDFGQAVVKVTPQSDGTLQATDFFSPGDADQLNANDHDLGSGGPAILPFTTKDYPNGLIVMAGKDARIFLLSAASLGGRSSSETGSTAVFTGSPSLVNDPSTHITAHGLWGHMAAFAGVGPDKQPTDYIYYEGSGWGSTDTMDVLKFDGTNPAAPVLENIGATSQSFGFSSGSPVISSNGTTATSAVVWEIHANDNTGAGGSLDAYSALPTSTGVLQEIWSSPIGDAAEFTVPATSGGRVYVGARNDGTAATTGTNATTCPTDFESKTYTGTDSACVGEVYGYGVLSGQLAGSTINLGHVALGQSSARTVTLANTGDTPVKITKITSPAVPFGTPALPPLNQPIAAGTSVSFPVTFTPQAKGGITGQYVVTTTDGLTTRTTTIAVGGVGALPASGTAFVPSPGGGWTLNGSAVMTGSTLQLTPAKASQVGSAIFSQPIPSSGLTATFTARLNGGNGGDGMTFSLLSPTSATTARGAGSGELGFGGLSGVSVVLGTRKDAGDPSANFVGIATGASQGHLVFAATSTKVPNLRSGTPVINVTVSGRTVTVKVNGRVYVSASVPVASTVLPAFTAANGGTSDIHAVSGVAISTTTMGPVPAPGGGWSFNGTAAMAGAATTLTQAGVVNQAGAVVYPRAVSTASFSATFNVALGGGTGGDGMTLALLNPGSNATSVGEDGEGLGFAGLNGLAVVLGTQQVPGAPSADFAGIETGTAGSAPTFVATSDLTATTNLRAGTHIVTVSLHAGTLTVSIDGSSVLTQAVTVPSSAYVAFTGSTGSVTDRHLVQNAAISAA